MTFCLLCGSALYFVKGDPAKGKRERFRCHGNKSKGIQACPKQRFWADDLYPWLESTLSGIGPQNRLSAFGLRIACDTYRTELTSDATAVHGGDGGESVCGGYGHMLAWLPLATANRNPSMAEFVYGPDGEDLCEDFSTRPVLTL